MGEMKRRPTKAIQQKYLAQLIMRNDGNLLYTKPDRYQPKKVVYVFAVENWIIELETYFIRDIKLGLRWDKSDEVNYVRKAKEKNK